MKFFRPYRVRNSNPVRTKGVSINHEPKDMKTRTVGCTEKGLKKRVALQRVTKIFRKIKEMEKKGSK